MKNELSHEEKGEHHFMADIWVRAYEKSIDLAGFHFIQPIPPGNANPIFG